MKPRHLTLQNLRLTAILGIFVLLTLGIPGVTFHQDEGLWKVGITGVVPVNFLFDCTLVAIRSLMFKRGILETVLKTFLNLRKRPPATNVGHLYYKLNRYLVLLGQNFFSGLSSKLGSRPCCQHPSCPRETFSLFPLPVEPHTLHTSCVTRTSLTPVTN